MRKQTVWDEATPSQADAAFRAQRAIGDAWSWLILRDLVLWDVRRFDALQRRSGIARATLTARLRSLEQEGLVARDGRAYVPTPSAEDVLGCLLTAGRWGAHWYPDSAQDVPPLIHDACGEPIVPVMRCRACGEVVVAREVTWSGTPAVEPRAEGAGRERAPRYDLLERGAPSPIARTMTVNGDRWSSLVLREAFFGTRRFDQFERRLGIAPNILTGRLQRLVAFGVLTRVQYQERPVRHEYQLTEKGLDLYPVLLALVVWGERWRPSTAPQVVLTHVTCGHRLEPELSCGRCGGAVTPRRTSRPHPR